MHPIVIGSLLLSWAVVVAAQTTSPPSDPAPLYIESSIVNAASPKADGLAPGTLATIYGQYLSRVTRAASADDIRAGVLPTVLPGTGVRVLIGGVLAPLLFVSPGQINFLVPATLLTGVTDLRVGIDSRYGPAVRVRLSAAAPALFQADPEFAIACRADGSLFTPDKPARPGDLVVFYGTGLGLTNPRPEGGQIVKTAAPLTMMRDFRVVLEGVEVPRESVLYAGLTPGFAGLYQVNVRLPEVSGRNPEVRIGFSEVMSPAGIRLYADPSEPRSWNDRLSFQLH